MRQISHLLIENFQSHQRSELAFGPGLNVIIGPSDNGKSAVLRALRWVLYNEPRGTDFVRFGARECRVTLTMSDGVRITRELLLTKSGAPARNRYSVQLPGSDEQFFEGFGTEVPAEVTRAHGMPQVLLDTDKRVLLSLGSQLEGPFLLTEPGSLRARAIGRLLGVHVVDAALRGTQRDLRSGRLEVARLEREVSRCDGELEGFGELPEEERRLALAQALLARAEQHTRELQRLQSLARELGRLEEESWFCRERIGRLDGLEAVAAKLQVASERTLRIAHLSGRLAGLSELAERMAGERRAAEQTEQELQQSLSEYAETLHRLGRCPTCLQPVAPEVIPRIIAELADGVESGHAHGSKPVAVDEGGC